MIKFKNCYNSIYFKLKKYKLLLVLILLSLTIANVFFGFLKWNPRGKEVTEIDLTNKLYNFKNKKTIKNINYNKTRDIFSNRRPFYELSNSIYKVELELTEPHDGNLFYYTYANHKPNFYDFNQKTINYKYELNVLVLFLELLNFIFNNLAMVSSIIFTIYIIKTMRQQNGYLDSNPQINPQTKQLPSFQDVAGLAKEKEEMQEIIHFLKNPKKYQEIGASIPKGVLLSGPPGTGKTLMAKAVAGQAGVYFYAVSGAEFDGILVGLGVKKIKKLFKEIRYNAPCILFIDEIDVLG